MTTEKQCYEGWAILELMGHRQLGGKVSQAEQYGTVMLRVDIPNGEEWATQFYGGTAIYALTPTTEAIARAVAERNQPTPVHTWELPAPKKDIDPIDPDFRSTDLDDQDAPEPF